MRRFGFFSAIALVVIAVVTLVYIGFSSLGAGIGGVASGVGSVATSAGSKATSMFSGFSLGFAGNLLLLTLVYIGILVALTYVMAARHRRRYRRSRRTISYYLGNEDTWLWGLVGATLTTLVVAFFNWGPALAMPENLPTTGFLNESGNILRNLAFGQDMKEQFVEGQHLPWASGTWFWWKATMVYALLSVFLAPFALHDNFGRAIQAGVRIWAERSEAYRVARAIATPAAAAGATAAPHAGMSLWSVAGITAAIEVLMEVLPHLFARARRAVNPNP